MSKDQMTTEPMPTNPPDEMVRVARECADKINNEAVHDVGNNCWFSPEDAAPIIAALLQREVAKAKLEGAISECQYHYHAATTYGVATRVDGRLRHLRAQLASEGESNVTRD